MKIRNLSLSVLMVFVLFASLALAEDAGNETDVAANEEMAVVDLATNDTVESVENVGNATDNATAETVVPAAPVIPQLQGIWFVDLQGAERVNMALNQSSEELFGAAKYEGSEPWNGDIVGSVEGDQVHLVLTALKGDVMVPIVMEGTYSNEAITGKYSIYNSKGKTGMGTFTAEWINPDTSGYLPAAIVKPDEVVEPEVNESNSPVQLGSTPEYHDVALDKDRIFSSPVSMIPPGMGGSGLS